MISSSINNVNCRQGSRHTLIIASHYRQNAVSRNIDLFISEASGQLRVI